MDTVYLQQQHSFLQQEQSQLHLHGLPFAHPVQEHSPLQHLHSLSQHDLLCFFILTSLIYIQIYPHPPQTKNPATWRGLMLYTGFNNMIFIDPFACEWNTHSFFIPLKYLIWSYIFI